jgi:transcription initiation factor TFIID subunit 15
MQDGSDFMNERLIVQFARGSRARNENFTPHERAAPRPRRTPFRMRIANLPVETSWQVRYPDPWISCLSG